MDSSDGTGSLTRLANSLALRRRAMGTATAIIGCWSVMLSRGRRANRRHPVEVNAANGQNAVDVPRKETDRIALSRSVRAASIVVAVIAIAFLLILGLAATPTAAGDRASDILPIASPPTAPVPGFGLWTRVLGAIQSAFSTLETSILQPGGQTAMQNRVYLPLVQSGETATQTHRIYIPFFAGPQTGTQPHPQQQPQQQPQPQPEQRPGTSPPKSATATPRPPIIDQEQIDIAVAEAVDKRPPRSLDKQSKIGIGVYADGGGYILNELMKARPGVVLLMDPNPEFAREVRSALPKAFIIGRRFAQYQPLDNPEERGAAFADYVAELAVPLRGIVDGWMSYNEPVARGDIAGFQAYNLFQVAFAKRLQGTYGIGAVAGNDPPGAVDVQEYPKYFGEAIRISKFFGIHAYSSPDSHTLRESDASWYVLRYRRIHQALEDAGIKSGPMILTEVGLAKGWREMGVNAETTTADFVWLADEAAKDDYLLGFAIFGLFPQEGWQPFDLGGTSVIERMGKYDPSDPIKLPTPSPTPSSQEKR